MTFLSHIIRTSEALHALHQDDAVTEGNATTPSALALSGWSPTDCSTPDIMLTTTSTITSEGKTNNPR